MLLRLDSAREAPVAIEETIELTASELEQCGLGGATAVATAARLDWADPDYLLTLSASYSQQLTCDRCLEEFWGDVKLKAHFLVVKGHQSERDRELEEDDLGVLVVEEEEIEPRPLVVEQIALNAPMKPLCRESCRGLCPSCGVDLNHETCSCKPTADQRWSALRDLVPQTDTRDR